MKFEMCLTITWSTRYYVLSNHLEEVTLLRANGPPDEMHKCILALIPEEILVVLCIKEVRSMFLIERTFNETMA